MKPKTPPKYRKLYEKISVDNAVIAALEKIKKQIAAENPNSPPPSYNKAIHYLMDNQQL